MKKRRLLRKNPEEALRIVLSHYGIKFDHYGKYMYRQHPLYPSMESVAYMLSNYGIDSSLIPVNLDEADEIPMPCVIKYDGLLLPVSRINMNGNVTIISEDGEAEEIPVVLSNQVWDGTALVVRPSEGSNNVQCGQKERQCKCFILL